MADGKLSKMDRDAIKRTGRSVYLDLPTDEDFQGLEDDAPESKAKAEAVIENEAKATLAKAKTKPKSKAHARAEKSREAKEAQAFDDEGKPTNPKPKPGAVKATVERMIRNGYLDRIAKATQGAEVKELLERAKDDKRLNEEDFQAIGVSADEALS